MQPFLSVVTIHLNEFGGLSRTRASLERYFGHPDFEWIVIDGGSDWQDNVQRALKTDIDSRASAFVSEPDKGIYDAMNKGAALCGGRYVLFINAGDELHSDFDLETLAGQTEVGGPGMIWGGCVECHPGSPEVLVRPRSPRWAWYGMPAYHPAILFRNDTLVESPYDTEFRIAADYDLVARLVRAGTPIRRSSMTISRFYLGGESDIDHATLLEEESIARSRYWSIPAWLQKGLRFLKRRLKRLSRHGRLRSVWRKWV